MLAAIAASAPAMLFAEVGHSLSCTLHWTELLTSGPVQSVATDVHPLKPVVVVPGRTDRGILTTLPSPLTPSFCLTLCSTAGGRRITQLRPTSGLPNVGCSWGRSRSRSPCSLSVCLVLDYAVHSLCSPRFTFGVGFCLTNPLNAIHCDRGTCAFVPSVVAIVTKRLYTLSSNYYPSN